MRTRPNPPLRQSITFTRPQIKYLREESERLGITVSDLVRRIVDTYRENLDRE